MAGRFGEVLIPTFTPDTGESRRSAVALEITRVRGWDIANFYCSREAYRANIGTDAERAAYPDALETCFLGWVEDGTFRP